MGTTGAIITTLDAVAGPGKATNGATTLTVGHALHTKKAATALFRTRPIKPRAVTAAGVGVEVATLPVADAQDRRGPAGRAVAVVAVVAPRALTVAAALEANSVLAAVKWRIGRTEARTLPITRQAVAAAHPLAADIRRAASRTGCVIVAGCDAASASRARRALADAIRGTWGTLAPFTATGVRGLISVPQARSALRAAPIRAALPGAGARSALTFEVIRGAVCAPVAVDAAGRIVGDVTDPRIVAAAAAATGAIADAAVPIARLTIAAALLASPIRLAGRAGSTAAAHHRLIRHTLHALRIAHMAHWARRLADTGTAIHQVATPVLDTAAVAGARLGPGFGLASPAAVSAAAVSTAPMTIALALALTVPVALALAFRIVRMLLALGPGMVIARGFAGLSALRGRLIPRCNRHSRRQRQAPQQTEEGTTRSARRERLRQPVKASSIHPCPR